MNADDPFFPKFDYLLDESDPDVVQVDALEGGTGHTTVVTTITRI